MYIGRNMYTCLAQITWLHVEWTCGKVEVIWVKVSFVYYIWTSEWTSCGEESAWFCFPLNSDSRPEFFGSTALQGKIAPSTIELLNLFRAVFHIILSYYPYQWSIIIKKKSTPRQVEPPLCSSPHHLSGLTVARLRLAQLVSFAKKRI